MATVLFRQDSSVILATMPSSSHRVEFDETGLVYRQDRKRESYSWTDIERIELLAGIAEIRRKSRAALLLELALALTIFRRTGLETPDSGSS